jgi:ACR3 family arsenite transporter
LSSVYIGIVVFYRHGISVPLENSPVAIGTFGVTSGQALAGVVGPLIEVPALVALVYVSLWACRRFFAPERGRPRSSPEATQ